MTNEIFGSMARPFLGPVARFASFIPTLAAVLLLLLAGMFLARALRTAVERLLAAISLDDYTSKVGINEVLARLGLGQSPAYALSFLIYWFILFVFMVSAANAVNLTVISDLLERFLQFLPALVSAILILFGGLLFARFLAEVVANASAANNVRGGAALSRGFYLVVVAYSGMAALEQSGMRPALITSVVQILIGSAGLAAAIAFGLGGRDAAAEILRGLSGREKS